MQSSERSTHLVGNISVDLENLYQSFPKLVAYCNRQGILGPSAEDIVQATIIYYSQKVATLNPRELTSYFFLCLRNACVDYFRKKSVKVEINHTLGFSKVVNSAISGEYKITEDHERSIPNPQLISLQNPVEDQVIGSLVHREVDSILQEMPLFQQQVFIASYIGLTNTETGKKLDKPTGTVKSGLFRVRKKVRDGLAEREITYKPVLRK